MKSQWNPGVQTKRGVKIPIPISKNARSKEPDAQQHPAIRSCFGCHRLSWTFRPKTSPSPSPSRVEKESSSGRQQPHSIPTEEESRKDGVPRLITERPESEGAQNRTTVFPAFFQQRQRINRTVIETPTDSPTGRPNPFAHPETTTTKHRS